jgi:hypothetical protein
MLKHFIILIIFIIYLVGFFYFLPAKLIIYDTDDLKDALPVNKENFNKPPIAPVVEKEDIGSSSEEVLAGEEKIQPIDNISATTETEIVIRDVLLDVPFTAQAPFGEWNNPIFQDGCEEAAVLMAIRWAKGGGLTKEEAKSEIIKLADYQKDKYGEYRDTSSEDTVIRIIRGYFGYSQAEVKRSIAVDNIIKELMNGNLVITPMNGQKLGNPHYTSPGPERHMLVIRGYDSKTKEFITNDPGTRLGEKYRYKEEVLYNAIRDYLTGYHLPIEKEEKVMIVVRKS